ncbi:hypothetical protein BaRGS_00022871 [Batillaria attramentaria]|uniref:Uncharacterized protein n=1 Tax=Batillaria attramentaria TaxID=370345 RepID=A0ABD0KFB4_9CAEN
MHIHEKKNLSERIRGRDWEMGKCRAPKQRMKPPVNQRGCRSSAAARAIRHTDKRVFGRSTPHGCPINLITGPSPRASVGNNHPARSRLFSWITVPYKLVELQAMCASACR